MHHSGFIFEDVILRYKHLVLNTASSNVPTSLTHKHRMCIHRLYHTTLELYTKLISMPHIIFYGIQIVVSSYIVNIMCPHFEMNVCIWFTYGPCMHTYIYTAMALRS